MTHGSTIVGNQLDKASLPPDAQRKAALFRMLMIEATAHLIRHRLSTFRSTDTIRADDLLITQLRQSGMARLTQLDGGGCALTMHGISVNAPTVRGALWQWATTANDVKGTAE